MIEELFNKLKMYGAIEYYEGLETDNIGKEELLIGLLKAEVDRRSTNALNRRLRYANFPLDREWEQIDHNINKKINFKKIQKHSDGKFVQEKKNLCFIGTTGLGKTHSLVAIGKDLCRQGLSIKCYSACDLVVMLEEAKAANELSKTMRKLMKPNLLVIDELGFVPFTENGARLLFDVFSKRYEHGSIAVSTNLAFQKWPQVFGSIELTQALIDRFTHRCDIYAFEGDSVRLAESKGKKTGRKK